MAATTTVNVPHLGGISAGYRLSGNDAAKPTVVLINSMCTTSSLYNDQFASKTLTDAVNLLAIEPLGHGATSSKSEHFTYWDTAIMALQVMEALDVKKAFVLGTSQGGWMVMRMALLAPEKVRSAAECGNIPSNPTDPHSLQILGVLPLGTSMDYESATSREQGCWNPKQDLAPFLEKWSVPDENFVVDEVWRGMVAQLGFSGTVSAETLQFWHDTVRDVYSGDEGRKKLRMATINLMERDGLLRRLRDVKCPVYWLQVRIVYCRPEEDDW